MGGAFRNWGLGSARFFRIYGYRKLSYGSWRVGACISDERVSETMVLVGYIFFCEGASTRLLEGYVALFRFFVWGCRCLQLLKDLVTNLVFVLCSASRADLENPSVQACTTKT